MTEHSSISDPSVGYNPITDFQPLPIKFGVYELHLRIGSIVNQTSKVDISEYFGQAEWEELSTIEQHNWLDGFTLSWRDDLVETGWRLL
jgi:hypothetical protein